MAPPRAGTALALLLIWASGAGAAQVRGTIAWDGEPRGPVSVALFPLDGQPLPAARPSERVMHLRGRQFQPSYLVAQVGDRLRLVNSDPVYHVLTAPYAPQPLQATLASAGHADAGLSLPLSQAGTWHVFCRIHRQSYGRIDVLSTPLVAMAGPDGRFSFDGLAGGRWRLRVAAPGVAAVYRELMAFTAPPPVTIMLATPEATPVGSDENSVRGLFPVESTPR